MDDKVRRGQLSYWISLKDVVENEDPKLQRNSSALESLSYFCTTANLQSAIVYLSQELQGMGLGCPLIEIGRQRLNLIALVNACWEVSQLYRASVRENSLLQDQHRRDTLDLNHFQNTMKDLRGSMDDKERTVREAQEKERQATVTNKSLAAKLRNEKEEVRKLVGALQQREAHHQHELRRRETENNRLRERLHQLVSGDRSADARQPAVDLSYTLTRSNRSRAKWKTEASSARHEEELYQRVLTHYETWVGQLNDENEQLKSCLSRVSSQVTKLATKYSAGDTPALSEGDMNVSMSSSTFSTDSLENLVVNLEFSAYREQMQQNFDNSMKTLAQLMEENAKNSGNEEHLKGELKELRRQLTSAKEELAVYTSTDKKGDMSKDGGNNLSFLVDGKNVEEEAFLEKEKQKLAAEKKLLQQERENFTEATIRLNRERAAFEAEKVELLKGQFLQELPTTLEADLAAEGHESGGSLSSSSIGEVFDSPQRVAAVPNITSPSGNITYIQGSPVVLGPSGFSKPQQDSINSVVSQMRSTYRLKSAPASRASSISRQWEREESRGQRGLGTIRPPSLGSRTLERVKFKSHSSTSTPLSKSRSQSQGDLSKGSNRSTKTEEASSYPSKTDISSPSKVNFHHKHDRSYVRRGRIYSMPGTYQREMAQYAAPHNNSPNYVQNLGTLKSKNVGDYCETTTGSHGENTRTVEALEADLTELMEQLAQQQRETVMTLSDDPPPYSEVICQKPRPKKVLSLFKSAPGSLLSSRRSSQDFSGKKECVQKHDEVPKY